MNWINFPVYAITSYVLWCLAIVVLYLPVKTKTHHVPANILLFASTLVLAGFIVFLWIRLGRPPLRTLGETRLWYSFFIMVVGLIIWLRWKYKWFLIIIILLAGIFLVVNLLNPDTYDKTLAPALQSRWFIPHVIAYMLSYAMLAVSCLVGLAGLYYLYFREYRESMLPLGDNLVYIGFSLLTFGLIFGALWAKVAWGHYWTWDPKETWAFLTWFGYLLYMHIRHFQPKKIKTPLWTLSLLFIVLLICWFGLSYLPSAANSVHVYSK